MLTGDLDVNIPGVSFNSQFEVAFANSGGNQTLTVSATGATLTVLDQIVVGDFTLERVLTTDGEQVVKVSASDVEVDLGGGLVTLTAGQRKSSTHKRRCGEVVWVEPSQFRHRRISTSAPALNSPSTRPASR